MGWNLEPRDLWRIIDKFLHDRSFQDRKKKRRYSNGWRDFSDRLYFGMYPHNVMYFAVRYDKNSFLSISVTGGPGWQPNERDRNYLVCNYLGRLFPELEPFIGLPTCELITSYKMLSTQILNIDFVWLADKTVSKSMDTIRISQSPKTILKHYFYLKNN